MIAETLGDCTAAYLESLPTANERNIKLIEFCSQLTYIANSVIFYFQQMKRHFFLTFIIMILIVILCVVLIKKIIELFTAKFVLSIKKRYDLSPLVVGTFILPVCYLFRELFEQHSSAKRDPFHLYYQIIALNSSFFNYLAIPSVFILFLAGETAMLPKRIVNINLFFILMIILTIQVQGINEVINYAFPIVLGLIGLSYILVIFLMVPKYNAQRLKEKEKWEKVDSFTREIAQQDKQINEAIFKDIVDFEKLKKKPYITEKPKNTVMYKIMNQIWDKKQDLASNIFQAPIFFIYLFTSPYSKNPLMKTILRYLIVFIGSYIIVFDLVYFNGFLICLSVATLTLIAYILIERFEKNKRTIKTFIEIIAIIEAQITLSLISKCMGDALMFFPYAFSMNRTSTAFIFEAFRQSFWRVLYGYVFYINGEFLTMFISYLACWIFEGTIVLTRITLINLSYDNKYLSLYGVKDPFIDQLFGFGANSQDLMIIQLIVMIAVVFCYFYYFNDIRGKLTSAFGKSMLVVWCIYIAIGFIFGLSINN